MKHIATLLSLLALSTSALSAADGWMTDLDKAFAKAKKEKKAVLVEFTGSDWCPPCQMMHKNVFSKKEFISKAGKDFILVELDFPNGDPEVKKRNQPHAEKYKIEAFPTVILFDDGAKEFTRFIASKYPTPDKFLAHLKSSLARKDLE
jgi:thiol-disulfide isomerase/thioredoxin